MCDSELLFSAQIRIWDPVTGKQLGKTLKGHLQWITWLCWEPLHRSAHFKVFSLFLAFQSCPFSFFHSFPFFFVFLCFFLPSFHSFSFFLSFLKQRNSLPCLGSVEWLINQCVYQCSATCVGDFHVPVTFFFFLCRNPECRMLASASKVHLYTKMWSKWS